MSGPGTAEGEWPRKRAVQTFSCAATARYTGARLVASDDREISRVAQKWGLGGASVRVLLDTNILIHREASVVVRDDIGSLFHWLDTMGCVKCIHPVSVEEIGRHADATVRRSFAAKLASYHQLRSSAPLTDAVQALSKETDVTENDVNDSRILNELLAQRVDAIITEDRKLARKARMLGLGESVYTIDGFLERAVAENPELFDYRVLSVKKSLFAHINLTDTFFDSFRAGYPGFDRWFARKSDDMAYVCEKDGCIAGFLYLKREDEREPYGDIYPPFAPKRRMKIGTLKVEQNGWKLGERFLKIAFDNAIKMRVDEVYVTLFDGAPERDRLVGLLCDYGFVLHGEKRNPYGIERVYVRDMSPQFCAAAPRTTFPYFSRSAPAYMVSIKPPYHTDLLPDSILNTESPDDFTEMEPHRNAIRKVFVSRSYFRGLSTGDLIVFYRTGGFYAGVITTIGIVERVHDGIRGENEFVRLCRNASVFSEAELRGWWRDNPGYRPFVVEFLYACPFPKRPNMATLIEHGVIRNIQSAPRGFERISDEQLRTVLDLAQVDSRLTVD